MKKLGIAGGLLGIALIAGVALYPSYVTQQEVTDYQATVQHAGDCIETYKWTPTTPNFAQHCTATTSWIGDQAVVKAQMANAALAYGITVCVYVPNSVNQTAIVNGVPVSFTGKALPPECQQ
jgi:hypothetical protein